MSPPLSEAMLRNAGRLIRYLDAMRFAPRRVCSARRNVCGVCHVRLRLLDARAEHAPSLTAARMQ